MVWKKLQHLAKGVFGRVNLSALKLDAAEAVVGAFVTSIELDAAPGPDERLVKIAQIL